MYQAIPKHRSSHQRCSVRKGALKNFTKFTGKNPCKSLFFNKIAYLRQFFLIDVYCVNGTNSRKNPKNTIMKSLDRGRRFEEKRYVNSDAIFC